MYCISIGLVFQAVLYGKGTESKVGKKDVSILSGTACEVEVVVTEVLIFGKRLPSAEGFCALPFFGKHRRRMPFLSFLPCPSL